MGGGTRKAGPAQRGKKVSGGHFFRPWESPRKSNGGPWGPAGDFRHSVRPSVLLPPRAIGLELLRLQLNLPLRASEIACAMKYASRMKCASHMMGKFHFISEGYFIAQQYFSIR